MKAKPFRQLGCCSVGLALLIGAPSAAQTAIHNADVPPFARQDYEIGKQAILNGEPTKALEALDDAVRRDPAFAKAHDGRGVALAMLNRREESETAFRTAIQLDDKFAEPRFNLGKLLLEENRAVEAEDELQVAVSLQPEHLQAVELLLDSMVATDDETSAIKLLGSLHSDHRIHPAQLHLELGAALRERGMRDEAIEQFRFVFSDQPSPSERWEAQLALWRLAAKP